MVKQNVATNRWQGGAAGTKGRLGRRVKNVAKPRNRKPGLMEILPHLRKAQNGSANPASKDIECYKLADCQRAIDHQLGAEIQDSGGHQLAD